MFIEIEEPYISAFGSIDLLCRKDDWNFDLKKNEATNEYFVLQSFQKYFKRNFLEKLQLIETLSPHKPTNIYILQNFKKNSKKTSHCLKILFFITRYDCEIHAFCTYESRKFPHWYPFP